LLQQRAILRKRPFAAAELDHHLEVGHHGIQMFGTVGYSRRQESFDEVATDRMARTNGVGLGAMRRLPAP